MKSELPHCAPTAAIPVEIQAILENSPQQVRRYFNLRQQAIAALDAAPNLKKRATARIWARRLGVAISTLYSLRGHYRSKGLIALVDRRGLPQLHQRTKAALPPLAIQYLKSLAQGGAIPQSEAVRAFKAQLARWRSGDASAAVPGYSAPPALDAPGLSARNLHRHLAPRTRTPAPGPVVLKVEWSIRPVGRAFLLTARQIRPRTNAKPMTWPLKGPRP